MIQIKLLKMGLINPRKYNCQYHGKASPLFIISSTKHVISNKDNAQEVSLRRPALYANAVAWPAEWPSVIQQPGSTGGKQAARCKWEQGFGFVPNWEKRPYWQDMQIGVGNTNILRWVEKQKKLSKIKDATCSVKPFQVF